MNDYETLEKNIASAYKIPVPSQRSIEKGWQIVAERSKTGKPHLSTALAWKLGVAMVLVLSLSILLVSPNQVLAKIKALFGYAPELGLVESGSTMRVLKEALSQTKGPVTIKIESVISSSTATKVNFLIEGTPPEAMPGLRYSLSDCHTSPYIQLKDGTRLRTNTLPYGLYGAIPADENRVKFVMPCIPFTKPLMAPNHWEFTLDLVPAPEGTLLSVTEMDPPPSFAQPSNKAPETPAPEPATAPLPENEPDQSLRSDPQVQVRVLRYVETETEYLLFGDYATPDPSLLKRIGGRIIEIYDGEGQLPLTGAAGNTAGSEPNEDQTAMLWDARILKAGLRFPLRIGITYGLQAAQVEEPNRKMKQSFVYWQPENIDLSSEKPQTRAACYDFWLSGDPLPASLQPGTRFLFTQNDSYIPRIVSAAVGDDQLQLVLSEGGEEARLSPDGSRLVYLLGSTLKILNLETGALLHSDAAARKFIWSHDSQNLAYTHVDANAALSLVTIDRNGKELSRHPAADQRLLGWSTGTAKLLMLTRKTAENFWSLETLDPLNNTVEQEIELPALKSDDDLQDISISPDGKTITYVQKDRKELYAYDIETEETKLILSGRKLTNYSWLTPTQLTINFDATNLHPKQSLILDTKSCSMTRLPAVIQGSFIGFLPDGASAAQILPGTPAPRPLNEVPRFISKINRVTETDGGYLLEGSIHPEAGFNGFYAHAYGLPYVHDKDFDFVPSYVPEDLRQSNGQPLADGGFTWVMELEGKDFKFPLNITYMGRVDQNPELESMLPGTNEQWSLDWQPNTP